MNGQGRPAGVLLLKTTPDRTPQGVRAVCQSVSECHDQKAVIDSVRRCRLCGKPTEGTPLIARADPETADNLNSDSTRCLTFDMSGGTKGAKRAL